MQRRQPLWNVFPTALTWKPRDRRKWKVRKEKVRIRTDLFGKEHALRTSGTNRCASAPFPWRCFRARHVHPNTTRESYAVSSAGRRLFQRRDSTKCSGAATKVTGASAVDSSEGGPTRGSITGEALWGEIILPFCCLSLCILSFFADFQGRRSSWRVRPRRDDSDAVGCSVPATVEIQRDCSWNRTDPGPAGIRWVHTRRGSIVAGFGESVAGLLYFLLFRDLIVVGLLLLCFFFCNHIPIGRFVSVRRSYVRRWFACR
jgi:hypothetical protein